MHETLKGFLDEGNYSSFLKSLKDLGESNINEIMKEEDIISFLVACYNGNEDYIKNNIDLEQIKSDKYFAFQLSAKSNQIGVMGILKDYTKENGDEDQWFQMVREDRYLAFRWAEGRAREWLKENYPVSYKLALRDNHIKENKQDSTWKLEIHQLDVGQGDSALVLFKKLNRDTRKYDVNKSILIDGGLVFNGDYLNGYISDKIGARTSLDAVIITHFDADHYLGIAQNMFMMAGTQGGKGISQITRAKANPHFTKDTKFILPKVSGTKDGGGRSSEMFHDALVRYYGDEIAPGVFKNILRGRDCIDRSIWEIVGGDRSDGAPNLKIVAADNVYNRGETSLGSINDNSRSSASIIGMQGFHFYTAGDFERNSDLIRCLVNCDDSKDYVPIQAFLTPHHGSSHNYISNKVINEMGARATIISSGSGYGHPDQKTITNLDVSELDFIYATNPIRAGRTNVDKVSEAGSNFTTDSYGKQTPRGTIKVQTYSNIAEAGTEKFLIKFKSKRSKTRDYYKDKDFGKLKHDLLSIISGYDADFAVKEGDRKLRLYLSESDLRHFLDEDGKVKHINPTTLRKFFDNYEDKNDRDYSLLISVKEDKLSFEIKSHIFKKSDIEFTNKRFESRDLRDKSFDRIDRIDTKLQSHVGFYFSEDERNKVINEKDDGTYNIKSMNDSEFIESRQQDKKVCDKYFLEISKFSEGDDNSLKFSLYEGGQEKTLLKKEYHKGVRTEKDSEDNYVKKVIARRIEYGDKCR